MRSKLSVAMLGLMGVFLLQVGACSVLQIDVGVPLGTSLGQFDVEAGGSQEQAGTITDFQDGSNPTIGSGSVALKSSSITITPTETGDKGMTNLQSNDPIVVTAWIDTIDNAGTVCGGGEEYGPYSVYFDDDYNVTSISPAKITLSQNTIDLLNGGSFSLCVRVESPIGARIEISELSLKVGL